MKVAYAACDVSKMGIHFAEKLAHVFLPYGGIGRLVKRKVGRTKCQIHIRRGESCLGASFSNVATTSTRAAISGLPDWKDPPIKSAYTPGKEMLANAPGFRSLYAQRDIHFEEIYSDILDRAYRPIPRGPAGRKRNRLLRNLRETIGGRVSVREEHFFLKDSRGNNLEFTLLAEGMRKLGLLWLLIQNGALLEGSVPFLGRAGSQFEPDASQGGYRHRSRIAPYGSAGIHRDSRLRYSQGDRSSEKKER